MATSDLTWRQLTVDDAAELARLAAAVEKADGLDDHRVEADTHKQLTDPMRGLDGTLGVFDGDRMVGFFQVWARIAAEPVHQMRSEGMVHPDYRRRGIGRRLLAWGREAALRIHAGHHPGQPLTLHAYANERNEGSTAALTQAGFKPVRWFFLMQRDLNGPPIGEASIPDDLMLTTYRDELSELLRIALNEGFIPDHWGSSPMTEDMWRHRITDGRQFRPDLTFLFQDKASGQVAAFLIAELVPEPDDRPSAEAHFALIGTRREFRRRGLASNLINHALTAARRAGYERASLEVDADNPSGALGVYERLGFINVRRDTVWETTLVG